MVFWHLLAHDIDTLPPYADQHFHATSFLVGSIAAKMVETAETMIAKLGWVGFVPGGAANLDSPFVHRGMRLAVKHNTVGGNGDPIDDKMQLGGDLKDMADATSAGVLDGSGVDRRVPPLPIVNSSSKEFQDYGEDVFVRKLDWLTKWREDSDNPFRKLKIVNTGSRGILHPHPSSAVTHDPSAPVATRIKDQAAGDDDVMYNINPRRVREGSLLETEDRSGQVMNEKYMDFPTPIDATHRLPGPWSPTTGRKGSIANTMSSLLGMNKTHLRERKKGKRKHEQTKKKDTSNAQKKRGFFFRITIKTRVRATCVGCI